MMRQCDTCGAWGHSAKGCPLRRLNEQQTVCGPSAARKEVAENSQSDDSEAETSGPLFATKGGTL
jgi:hypothetical protein